MMMTKRLVSSEAMSSWLRSLVNAKLYNVLFEGWTKNTVKLEGKPLDDICTIP